MSRRMTWCAVCLMAVLPWKAGFARAADSGEESRRALEEFHDRVLGGGNLSTPLQPPRGVTSGEALAAGSLVLAVSQDVLLVFSGGTSEIAVKVVNFAAGGKRLETVVSGLAETAEADGRGEHAAAAAAAGKATWELVVSEVPVVRVLWAGSRVAYQKFSADRQAQEEFRRLSGFVAESLRRGELVEEVRRVQAAIREVRDTRQREEYAEVLLRLLARRAQLSVLESFHLQRCAAGFNAGYEAARLAMGYGAGESDAWRYGAGSFEELVTRYALGEVNREGLKSRLKSYLLTHAGSVGGASRLADADRAAESVLKSLGAAAREANSALAAAKAPPSSSFMSIYANRYEYLKAGTFVGITVPVVAPNVGTTTMEDLRSGESGIVNFRFASFPPAQLEIASRVRVQWACDSTGVEYRYKLDVPGHWLFGFRDAMNQWSDWDHQTSVDYHDFVVEGTYRIEVEARKTGNVERLSGAFNMVFVPPEILSEGITIDLARVAGATTTAARYWALADEYRKAYSVWSQLYDRRRRVLDASWSPDELLGHFEAVTITQASGMLLENADFAVGLAFKKVLLPSTIYSIVKQTGVSLVLIYRNREVNEAAFHMLASYWAWKGFEGLAAREELGGHGQPVVGKPGVDYLVFYHNDSLQLIREVGEGEEDIRYDLAFDLEGGDNLFRVFLLDNYAPGMTPRDLTADNILAASSPRSYTANLELLDLMVTLSWDTNRSDVDLHLVPATMSNFARQGSDCFYQSKTPDWGAAENNPALDIDDTNGYGPENIVVSKLKNGKYYVVVHYYSEHGAGESSASVSVRIRGGKPLHFGPLRLPMKGARVVVTELDVANGAIAHSSDFQDGRNMEVRAGR